MDKKEKVLNLICKLRSASYHHGTFASIAHKYREDFERQSLAIDTLYDRIVSLLDEINPASS